MEPNREEQRGIIMYEDGNGTWNVVDTVHHQAIKLGVTQSEARETIEKLMFHALKNQ